MNFTILVNRIAALIITGLTLYSCDATTETTTQLVLDDPYANRQILALEDSTLRVKIAVNNGPEQLFLLQPNRNTLSVPITGIRENDTNTIVVKWCEILNGYEVQLSVQIHTFVAVGGSTTISAPHDSNPFDYDNDGINNLEERRAGRCVWSSNESCREAGQLDIPSDREQSTQTTPPASIINTDTRTYDTTNNLLQNGDFNGGITPFYSYADTEWTGDTWCSTLLADPSVNITEYLHYPDITLEDGNYSLQFDVMSTNKSNVRTIISLYQQATSTTYLEYDVVPSQRTWRTNKVGYTHTGLPLVQLAISGPEDPVDPITLCFDNIAIYKEL